MKVSLDNHNVIGYSKPNLTFSEIEPGVIKSILFALFFLFLTNFLHGQENPQVTILGVHHFHNPGADLFNIHQDNIKAPKRQAEVLDLVERLLKFKPTKVVVEKVYGDSALQQAYRNYLSHPNDEMLTGNERQQVGFRIAARMGHEAIHLFDYKQGMDLSELRRLGQRDLRVGEMFQDLMSEVGGFIAQVNEDLKEMTIPEFLILMNEQEGVDYNHQGYLRMLQMTGEDSYGASKGVSDWYGRNIHMFYNLNRIVDFESADERILIIVGQGHKAILQDLIEDALYYHYIDVLKYLRQPVTD